jgi:threonine/homoserine/homoserine lactone efflux protein
MLEPVRYCGGAYLLWLAFKSLRSAMVPGASKIAHMPAPRGHFMAGLALHMTNSKPILFFGTLFSIGVPPSTSAGELVLVVTIIGLKNALYSSPMPSCSPTGPWREPMRGQGAGSRVCSQPFLGSQVCEF